MKLKRLVSAIVAVGMMVAMLPVSAVTAFAAATVVTTTTVDDVKYELYNDNTATVVGPGDDFPGSKQIEIKSSVSYSNNYYTVTEIKASAFYKCTKLTGGLEIPSTVKTIGQYAFSDCSNLNGVLVINNGVNTIGDYVFRNCSGLTGLKLPDSVTSIGIQAFYGCSGLKSELKIPSKITWIGNNAFFGCSGLTGSIIIPETLTSIEASVFGGCSSLNGTLTIGKNVKSIGYGSFYHTGLSGNLEIPESVTSIGGYAFSGCENLTGNVDIPSGVTSIGEKAFDKAGIEKIVLSDNLQNLEKIDTQGKKLFYNGTRSDVEKVLSNNTTIQGLDKENLKIGTNYICYYCDVDFDTDGGTPTSETQKNIIRMDTLDTSKINTPSKQGYVFNGWYYVNAKGENANFSLSSSIPDSITLIAKWLKHATATIEGFDATVQQGKSKEFTVKVNPNDDTGNAVLDFGKDNANIEYKDGDTWKQVPDGGQPIDLNDGAKDYQFRLVSVSDASNQTLRVSIHRPNNELGGDDVSFDTVNENKLTVVGGTVKVNGTAVELDANNSCVVKKDSLVEVTFDKSILSDNQSFDQWTSDSATVLNAIDPKSETVKFTMPAEKVTLEAMTKNADIDDSPNILGTAAVIGTVAVGGAVIAWQGYNIAADLYAQSVLPEGAAIPETKEALAVMLWQNAGKPEVVAADGTTLTETEQAQQWVVANGLMENEEDGTFHPEKGVGKFAALNAIKAQTEKTTAQ